jgi:hypothetical protein
LIRAKANSSRDINPNKPSPGSSPGPRLIEKSFAQIEALPAARTGGYVGQIALRPISPLPSDSNASNWSGSFWLAAREGSALGLTAGNSQLGGSQAGVRVYRRLTPALALTGRISSALSARQGEASIGVALRRGPFGVFAERRIAFDSGGRNDWSVTAVAGVSDVRLPLGLRLDGYAQAGIVGRDGFADGALRVERTVLGAGGNRLSVGAGTWGSVQPGVARLDVGPQIVAHTALASRAFRVSAEWRQRIAGNAAPGSGPAVTFGADF